MANEHILQALLEAERSRQPIGPVSDLVEGGLSLGEAHRLCEVAMAARYKAGEVLVGYKIGFTNIAVRTKMGLPDSTYGYLTDRMVLGNGGDFDLNELIAPKLECELCLRVGESIPAGASIDQVLGSVDGVIAAYEICDARIRDWKCPYSDFFADNGFSARIVLGDKWLPVDALDLLGEEVVLSQDGKEIARGVGENALGHPAKAVAWLADRLAERGQSLQAGQLVMTGTLTPILPIEKGSRYQAVYSSLGTLDKRFV
ncbi:MAG: hypothetical protein GXY52_09570 [Chloroflexi bacterium]|nr:hypothetical protein [Chloroflexota bacterium]